MPNRLVLVRLIHVVVFSLQSAKASLKHLGPDYFLGKVCFMVTNGMERFEPSNSLIPDLLLTCYSGFCYISFHKIPFYLGGSQCVHIIQQLISNISIINK